VYENEPALTRTLERQSRLLTAYEEVGGLKYENTVKATLRRLGFEDSDFTLSTAVLSGGQNWLPWLVDCRPTGECCWMNRIIT
jgi:ATPase subunit of ABC transporter with duplicated ATPase domains